MFLLSNVLISIFLKVLTIFTHITHIRYISMQNMRSVDLVSFALDQNINFYFIFITKSVSYFVFQNCVTSFVLNLFVDMHETKCLQ